MLSDVLDVSKDKVFGRMVFQVTNALEHAQRLGAQMAITSNPDNADAVLQAMEAFADQFLEDPYFYNRVVQAFNRAMLARIDAVSRLN